MKKPAFLTKGGKYERESILITAAFALLVIVCNLLLYFLANTFGWYVASFDRQYFTLTGATDAYFSAVNPDGRDVDLYFCMPEDKLRANATYERIFDTAKQFDDRYAWLHVGFLDQYYDYETLSRYASDNGTEIGENAVIAVNRLSDRSSVRDLSDFYLFDKTDSSSDEMIFVGEKTVASLVARVMRTAEEGRTVCFTVGHGETATSSFESLLTSAGYEVSPVDLSATGVPDSCDVLLICNPSYDFIEYADRHTVSEISRLRDYLAGGGTVFCFRSPEIPALPRLDDCLSSYGMEVTGGTLIKDSSDAVGTLGTSLLLRESDPLAEKMNAEGRRTVFSGVGAVRIADALPSGVNVTPLLYTSSSAAEYANGGKISSAPAEGYIAAARADVTGNGKFYLFSASSWGESFMLDTGGYANESLFYALLTEATGKVMPAGCGTVVLNAYPLENLSTGRANTLFICLTFALPACVAIAGAIVCFRRRRK